MLTYLRLGRRQEESLSCRHKNPQALLLLSSNHKREDIPLARNTDNSISLEGPTVDL